MPIEEHSSEAALRNLKSTCSMWPVRGKGNRKGLVPLPEVKPRFRIEDNDQIFCMGSCFAHHVASVLQACGFKVATNQPNPHMQGDWGGSNHLIRYNIFSILNEFRWALAPGSSFPDDGFVSEPNGLFMDPYGHSQVKPHTKAFVTELRQFTHSVTKRLVDCRVVVLTLGLAEVWYDRKAQLYTNIQPAKHALLAEPERFTFRVLGYDDILGALEELRGLVKQYGCADAKFLITTSPVPLHASFRGQDVFTANTYSKSVQRAAVGEFVTRHPDVDYFPSYEAVTLGNAELAFKEDQRHVTEQTVNAIMEHVLRAYAPQKNIPLNTIQELRKLDEQLSQFGSQLTFMNVIAVMNELKKQRDEGEKLRLENAGLRRKLASAATACP
jgi:hypothetical protein